MSKDSVVPIVWVNTVLTFVFSLLLQWNSFCDLRSCGSSGWSCCGNRLFGLPGSVRTRFLHFPCCLKWRKKIILNSTTIWVNSADDKLIFFLFFPENIHFQNRLCHFMQIVSFP